MALAGRIYWPLVVITAMAIVTLRVMLGLSIAQYPDLIVTMLSGFIVGIVTAAVILSFSTKKSLV